MILKSELPLDTNSVVECVSTFLGCWPSTCPPDLGAEHPPVLDPWRLCWPGLLSYERAVKLPRTWGSTAERAESSELGCLVIVLLP